MELDSYAIQQIRAPLAHLHINPEVHWYRMHDRTFMPIPSTSTHTERWYYVPDQARLLGYDRATRKLVGTFGPDGFVPAGHQSSEHFPGQLYYRYGYFVAIMQALDFLPFSDSVYRISFPERTLQALVAPGQGQTILGAEPVNDEKKKVPLYFVLTPDAVRAVDEAGSPVFSAPLAYDPKGYDVDAGRLDNLHQYVIWYRPRRIWTAENTAAIPLMTLLLSNYAFSQLPSVWAQAETRSSYVIQYDMAGHEAGRQTVPPLPAAAPAPGQAFFGLVTPLAGTVLYGGAYQHHFPAESRLATGLRNGPVLAFIVLMVFSATVCALVCLLLARSYAFSKAGCVGWSLCGLLFGPAGLLLLLALQDWPARVACPDCRMPRVVLRDRCEHCGAPHASPPADGTEVFEITSAAIHTEAARLHAAGS
jgi:hypothetical protein